MDFFDDLSEQVDVLSERAGAFLDDVLVPDEVARLLERAAKLVGRGDYDQALDKLERARQQTTNVYRLDYLTGLCHFHRQQFREAESALQRALELRETADAHYYAGLTAEQRNKWSSARRHFSRALALEETLPYEAALHFGLGRIFLKLDRPDRAVRDLERALNHAEEGDEPSAVDADTIRIFLGDAHLRADDPKAAHEVTADIDPPEDPEVLTLFGRIAAAAGHLDDAADYFRRALTLDPSHGRARLAAGRLARRQNRLDDAERHLLEAVNTNRADDLPEIYCELGPLYEQKDDHEQAYHAYRAALDDAKDETSDDETLRAELHLRAARVCLELERYADARDHFERADELSASDPHSALHQLAERGLADAALRDGRLSDARRRLDTLASREEATDAETLWLRARLHLQGDDPGEALAAAHTALEQIDRDECDGNDVVEADASDHRTDRLATDDRLRIRLRDLRDEATSRLGHDWRLPSNLEDSVDVEQALETVRDFLTDDPRLDRFFPRWRAISDRMARPLSVALVGEFNAGKSTLANALLGEEVVPTGILPTTAHMCRIGYGARRACRIVYHGATDEPPRDDGPPDQPVSTSTREYTSSSGVDRLRSVWNFSDVVEVDFEEASRRTQDEEEADDIHHLEYLYPHPRLRSLELIDTPGFNAEDKHADIARGVIDEAEAIVWVLDAGQALSMTEFDVIDDIRDSDERLVVVLNKLDELGETVAERQEAADELHDYLEQKIGARIAGLFPMSAERVLLDDDSSEAAELNTEQFDDFTDRLEGDIVQRSGRLKTLEARRELSELADDLAAFRADHLQSYDGIIDSLQQVADELDDRASTLVDDLPGDIAGRVDDQIDFATEAAAGDLEDMMRPADNWIGQALGERSLDESDRAFVTDMLEERIDEILDRAQRETSRRADVLQNDAIDELDATLERLETTEHRFARRRLESLVDESRAHRVLLRERVFGQLRSNLRASLDDDALQVFGNLADGDLPRDQWPERLKSTLPPADEHLRTALASWCDTFGRLLTRTARRLADDIQLLRLEADATWQLDPLVDLVGTTDPTRTDTTHTE